jgi:hypothetical protein
MMTRRGSMKAMRCPCKADPAGSIPAPGSMLSFDFAGSDPAGCGRKCRQQIDKWVEWCKVSPCLGGAELREGYLYLGNPLALAPVGDPGRYRGQLNNARRRIIKRAYRLGYAFGPMGYNANLEGIYRVNMSRPTRGGIPMSAGYRERPKAQTPYIMGDLCDRHSVCWYGGWHGDELRCYAVAHCLNEVAILGTILGHPDYFRDGIMNALVDCIVTDLSAGHPSVRWLNYLTLVSGRAGLVEFKRAAGFQSYPVRVRDDYAAE